MQTSLWCSAPQLSPSSRESLDLLLLVPKDSLSSPSFPSMLLKALKGPSRETAKARSLTSELLTTKAQRSRHASQTFMVVTLGSRQQFCKGRRSQRKKWSSLKVAVLLLTKGRRSRSPAVQASSDQATQTWQSLPSAGSAQQHVLTL